MTVPPPRMPRPRRAAEGAGGALLVALAMACGSPGSDGTPRVFEDTIAATTDIRDSAPGSISALGDSAGVPAEGPAESADPGDPFAIFGSVGRTVADTTIHAIVVEIVNTGEGALTIRAEGGAGFVTVDTLAAGDSARVRLETRADSVRVVAFDAAGVERVFRWLRTDTSEARVAFP